MNGLKIKKAPIILPLLLLTLSLAAYTVLNFQGVSAADSISLGQQRLNDLDYSGAVAAFTKAIELDPSSRESRLGLAQAYVGSGDYSLAQQVLEDAVGKEKPDTEAAKMMIDIYRKNRQFPQAVQLVQELINTTDEDEYYELRESILKEIYAGPRSVAVGIDQSVVLFNGQVLASGSNSLGQMGLEPLRTSQSEKYIAAGFPGKPAKAVCAGRTSLIIDAEGGLWAAGENRWGQLGTGSAETSPEGGWRQIACPKPVVNAAGTTGRLLILLEDGTLWTAGAENKQVLTQLHFSTVTSIDSNAHQAAALTADGRLYCSSSDAPKDWRMAAKNVRSFSVGENGLCWVGNDNSLYTESGIYSSPSEWYGHGNVSEEIIVDSFTMAGNLALAADANGGLYRVIQSGVADKVERSGLIAALYVQGDAAILEYEDGTAEVWKGDGSQPQSLEEYVA